jgi:hypothetical protein
MDSDMSPPPYSAEDRKTATFAEVAKRVAEDIKKSFALRDALEAFKTFLASQENVTLSK